DRGVVGTSTGAPETVGLQVPWLPLQRAARLPSSASWVPDRWRDLGTELAAAPVGRPDLAVLVGRIGGPRWRDGELARLAHLAGITATVVSRG
ncbi:MAG: amino acid-binding protein, partial [Frankiales bacterium]|nr:amino acid-binding protein [Frankiales bacterium]